MSKIVIGYEQDERGEDALMLGRTLAEVLHARPVILTAALWPVYLMSAADRERALQTEFGPALEIAGEKLRALDPETRAVEASSVAAALTAAAEETQTAAVVIGSSHHGAVGRVVLGSTGGSLVHGAPCAVAVAQTGLAAEEGQNLLRIGVAFDGSPEAWAALDAAIGIATRTRGRLSVFTVAHFPSYGLGSAWAAISAAEIVDAEEREKHRILELAMNRVPDQLPVEGRYLQGEPGALLAEATDDLDLFVMGSRSYGPIGRTFLGSTARHVVHHATASVLVLPRGTGAGEFALDPDSEQVKELA